MPFAQVLPRLRKPLQKGTKTLCRALGSNVMVSVFGFVRYQAVGKGYTEQTKIAISKNRTAALLRALIHVVPVTVALWEIFLNWNNYFVGYNVLDQAYYQFGAKIHEMAVQASLSAVIFAYVRHELMLEDGLPFGALFSGLQISQVSYLWSMEFWGTFWSRKITNAAEVPTQCINANVSGGDAFACPAHGWEAIQDFVYDTLHTLDPKYLALLNVVLNPDWVELTGRGSQRRLALTSMYGFPRGYAQYPVGGTTQQSVIADALTETGEIWDRATANISTSGHGSVLEQQDAVHTINNGYFQPYTTTACARDVIRGPYDESVFAFPVPPVVQPDLMLNQSEYNDSILGIHSFVYPAITKHQVYGTPGSPEISRLRWVELPQNPFNGSAIGAIILLPRPITNLTQDLLVCTLGAGWGSSIINTSSFDAGTTFTTSIVDPSAVDQSMPPPINQSSPFHATPREEVVAADDTMYYDLPFYPQKLVIVTEAWANYLNFLVPALNTTVIDALMSNSKPFGTNPHVQELIAHWALSGLLAIGLASIGTNGRLQGDIKTVVRPDGSREVDGNYWFSGKGDMFSVDPEESKGWVKLRVDSMVSGYAYNIRGKSPKFAISFLLAYCIIALSHVMYAGITGISSTCWDSIGEVTALAMNSTPATHLKNTCAGIMELDICKLPVRVLAIRDCDGDGEHLELVFGDVDEKDARGTPITPNRVYGTLPKMAKGEKSE